jgi:hypothetical protein
LRIASAINSRPPNATLLVKARTISSAFSPADESLPIGVGVGKEDRPSAVGVRGSVGAGKACVGAGVAVAVGGGVMFSSSF